MMRIILLIFLLITGLCAYAQKGREAKPGDEKRNVTKREIKFYAGKYDSICFHLNRMIRFEKELRQKNYYLNEKTALVDELLSILLSIESSLEVVHYTDEDIKKIFGRKRLKLPGVYIYQVETYKSNCAFMEISVFESGGVVKRISHRVTDCERLK